MSLGGDLDNPSGGGGGGGGAPTDASYITQTPNGDLSSEQALSALATGLLKNTTTTGVLSIAAQGTDYYAPGGTDVAVADGGTGASTAGGAKTNLGFMTDLVDDATPQLGGDLDTNGNQILVSGASGVIAINADSDGGEYNIAVNTTGVLALYGSAGETLNVKLLDGYLQIDALTASRALYLDANKRIASHANVTDTELGYLDGVTSAIQTQLNTKVDTANSPNANEFARFTDADTIEGRTVSEVFGDLGITSSAAELNILDGATLSTAELNILDGVTATAAELNALDGITATVAELNHTDGVTSAIQTQLDAKAPLASPVFSGSVDLNGIELILDADADTSITADTDDQIDIKIANADDFRFVSNTFRALSGSAFETDTINETTAAAGVTIDGVLVKDGQIGATYLQAIYPVGCIYISVVSTNPATVFGFGTWAAFGTGRVLVGIDAGQTEFDTVEETGGANTHTLTVTEMPAHTHTQVNHVNQQNNTGGTNRDHVNTGSTIATGSAGGGGAHNNLQPYIVVYMFKRTA